MTSIPYGDSSLALRANLVFCATDLAIGALHVKGNWWLLKVRTISVALTELRWLMTMSLRGESGFESGGESWSSSWRQVAPSSLRRRRRRSISMRVIELTKAYSMSALKTRIMQKAYLQQTGRRHKPFSSTRARLRIWIFDTSMETNEQSHSHGAAPLPDYNRSEVVLLHFAT